MRHHTGPQPRLRFAARTWVAVCLSLLVLAGSAFAAPSSSGGRLQIKLLQISSSQSLSQLLDRGVRVHLTCTVDCQLAARLRVSPRLARDLGLGTNQTVGLTNKHLAGGRRAWVRIDFYRRAVRAIEDSGISHLSFRLKLRAVHLGQSVTVTPNG